MVRIQVDSVANVIGYQPLQPDSGVVLDEERVVAVRSDPSLHLESGFVCQPLQPDSGVSMDEERVIVVRSDPNLLLEFFQPTRLCVSLCSQTQASLGKRSEVLPFMSDPILHPGCFAKRCEVIGGDSVVRCVIGFQAASIVGVNHDAWWVSMVNKVRNLQAHALCSVTDCEGFVEKKFSSTATAQHVYSHVDK